MTLEAGLTALVWVVALFLWLIFGLVVIGLIKQAMDWIYEGFEVQPIRDRNDTRDPWLEPVDVRPEDFAPAREKAQVSR